MSNAVATSGIGSQKISALLASRVDSLRGKEKIRAVVLLDGGEPRRNRPRSFLRLRRRSRASVVPASPEAVLSKVDSILKQHGGVRITAVPNALGGIVVETTSAGILALARSEHVKTIFEDQTIRRLK